MKCVLIIITFFFMFPSTAFSDDMIKSGKDFFALL